MRIVHISDTHNMHRELAKLPDGDILVHTGDCTMAGTEAEAYRFLDWFCDQPHQHKIYIAGNHDFCFYGMTGVEGLPDNIHYLCNKGITIEGINFYGVPLFIYDIVEGRYENMLTDIPNNTDVLLAHQPPEEAPLLTMRIKQIKPYAVLYGHNHSTYGQKVIDGTIFSNAAQVNDNYELTNAPNVIDI